MSDDESELYVWLDGMVPKKNHSNHIRDRSLGNQSEDMTIREHIDLLIRNADLFPPDRLDRMLDNASRDETTLFIHLYYDRILLLEPVPNHWHIFAAALLRKASDAVNGEQTGLYTTSLTSVAK